MGLGRDEIFFCGSGTGEVWKSTPVSPSSVLVAVFFFFFTLWGLTEKLPGVCCACPCQFRKNCSLTSRYLRHHRYLRYWRITSTDMILKCKYRLGTVVSVLVTSLVPINKVCFIRETHKMCRVGATPGPGLGTTAIMQTEIFTLTNFS